MRARTASVSSLNVGLTSAAVAPADARTMRFRRRLFDSMITFWPQELQLLARRPNVLRGMGW
jgi:hypothetical protein